MWCRAFIATIALTCTFTTVQAHVPNKIKDIICVLILNGVQKEDLDVNTLNKLQRHNVNIEDMNNEELRKECMKVTGHSKAGKVKTMHLPESSGEQKKLIDSNLQYLLLNYFGNPQKENDSAKPRTETPNIHYFMNMLNKLNKTAQHIAVETTTNFMSLNKRREHKNMDYVNKILEKFIAFQKLTTTNRPTTTQIDYDDFAQKINELLLKKNSKLQKKTLIERNNIKNDFQINNDSMKSIIENLDVSPFKIFGTAIKTAAKKENKQSRDQNLLSQIKMLYSDNEDSLKIITTTVKPKIFQTTTKNQNKILSADIINKISDSVKANVLKDLQISMSAEPNIQLQNSNINTETQPLTADVIKEISDSVKARVLKDIQDAMSTTLKPLQVTTKKIPITVKLTEKPTKVTTKRKTIISTTVKTTEKPQEEQKIIEQENNKPNTKNNDNQTENVLVELMKMFQEFKTSQNNSALHATQVNTPNFGQIRKDAEGPDPSWAQVHPLTITPIIMHPVFPVRAVEIQSALETPVMQTAHANARPQDMSPNSPFSLLSLPAADKDRTITQFNIFNPKENNHLLPPALIQTNSAEVHPIGVPAEHSYVYQNIIVSTSRPLQRIRHENPRNSNFYMPQHSQNKNNNNNNNAPRYYKNDNQNRVHYKNFGPVRNEMRNGDYYRPQYYERVTRRPPVRHGNYAHHAFYNDRKKERFHEKLEKSDNYGRPHMIRYREHGKDLEFSTAKIASRLQMPMYRQPKKYDAHFNNFMKTQQKVNDMLERILATKTEFGGEETKSVETV